ncbi:MAG: right-handed parallel beta-helix repeat-containing protein [Candidatus Paceibacterota bacterium]|jgi:pimeloyl-ACP methyl ester carboxylesterase
MNKLKDCSFGFITSVFTKKFYFAFLFTAVVFITSGFLFTKVSAYTVVDMDITENTTWDTSGSPYVVDSILNINEGKILSILPGVVVKFNWGGSLIVDGKLDAEGTEESPIYFTSIFDDSVGGDTNGDGEDSIPYEGDWDYILIESTTSQSILNNVFEKYSNEGLLLYNGGSVNSTNFNSSNGILAFGSNSSFSNLTTPFIELYDGSTFLISDSLISNQTRSSMYVYNNSSLHLKNSIVEGRDDDIINIFENSSALFDSVQVVGDFLSSTAFTVFNDSSLDIINSSVSDNYDGYAIFNESSLSITDSSIECGNEGIVIFNNSSLNLSGGNISCLYDGITIFNEVTANIEGVKITDALNAGIIVFNHTDISPINVTRSEITGNDYGFMVFNSLISVHQNNIHDNFTEGATTFSPANLDFTSNYWGDPSGPTHISNSGGIGDSVSDNILFLPFLTEDPLVECCSNIIFLPGIKGSRLYRQKTILGLNIEDQLWEPNWYTDIEDLYLDSNGVSLNSNVYTRDIIQETNIPFPIGSLGMNFYKSFSNMLNHMVDFEIKDWESYAYDWRYGVNDIINNGTKYEDENLLLVNILEELIHSSKSGKVTIVAHSNGGLLAKALLKRLEEDKIAGINNFIDNIDNLILVGSPEIGTASAVPALLHAYDQRMVGGILMNEKIAREFGRNMVGAYGLLPSKEYIERVSASPVTFVDNTIPSSVTTQFVQNFGSVLDSYQEYKNFLFGSEGRDNPDSNDINLPISLSENLFTKAENLHNSIDSFVPPENLRVIEIAGWGLDTLASYEYYPKLADCEYQNINCYKLDQRPRFTADGDNTVITPSAHYMSLNGSEKYYFNLLKYNNDFNKKNRHADLLEINPILDFISNIITNNSQIDSPYISATTPIDPQNRLRLSVHSPITLDAYDIEGNHTGKICPSDNDFCYIEENIPNSSYLEFGEGKYLNLPEDKFSKIKLQGIDIGTFTYESEKVLSNGVSVVSSFVDIPVTTQSQAEITLNKITQVPELKLDVTGDGIIDFIITPNDKFEPIVFLQIMKKTIESFNISKPIKNILLKRIDDTIRLIQKGKIRKAKLSVEQFRKALNIYSNENRQEVIERRRREIEYRINRNIKQLKPTEIQTLIVMLNQLLDNIN